MDKFKIAVWSYQFSYYPSRLQDSKSISSYNLALYDIVSRLELCGVNLTKATFMLEYYSALVIPVALV